MRRAYVADGVERDDRLRDILKFAAENNIPLLQATRTELDRLTGGGVHQGVALQLPPFEYADNEDVLFNALNSDTPGLVVACDSITDPRNLGAIVRSAAAFGAHGVIIPERRSAQMTAAAWKTSAGAAARVPVAQVTNLNRTIKAYADAGFTVVGLAGEAETDIAGFPGIDGPVLVVVGSEGDGLARLVRENCDLLVTIPIQRGCRVAQRQRRGCDRALRDRARTRLISSRARGRAAGGTTRSGAHAPDLFSDTSESPSGDATKHPVAALSVWRAGDPDRQSALKRATSSEVAGSPALAAIAGYGRGAR